MLLRQNEIGLYPTVLSYLLWGSENRWKGGFEKIMIYILPPFLVITCCWGSKNRWNVVESESGPYSIANFL